MAGCYGEQYRHGWFAGQGDAFYSGDLMAVQQLSPEINAATTGAGTRELVTGATYASRTEGAGYWRDVQSMDPTYGAGASTAVAMAGAYTFIA